MAETLVRTSGASVAWPCSQTLEMVAKLGQMISDHQGLLEAFRERAKELEISREGALMISPAGPMATLASYWEARPQEARNNQALSLALMLGALGLKMILIEDPEATARALARRNPVNCQRFGIMNAALKSPCPRPIPAAQRLQRGLNALDKKAELEPREAVPDIFHCACMKPGSLGHRLQTATQLGVAFLHMVSNFAAFKLCDRGVGDPPPSYRLPLLQIVYFTTQQIRFRHLIGPALEKVGLKLILKNP